MQTSNNNKFIYTHTRGVGLQDRNNINNIKIIKISIGFEPMEEIITSLLFKSNPLNHSGNLNIFNIKYNRQ